MQPFLHYTVATFKATADSKGGKKKRCRPWTGTWTVDRCYDIYGLGIFDAVNIELGIIKWPLVLNRPSTITSLTRSCGNSSVVRRLKLLRHSSLHYIANYVG